jgi:hypothetical protein
MFGAMGYLGKVKFSDAVQVESERVEIWEMPQMFRPRTDNPDGRKFYKHGKQAKGDLPVEAVPADNFFEFKLRFDNLTPAELGLLVLALGLSPNSAEAFNLKLGGFKPACLGSVAFEPQRLVLESEASCLDYDVPAANFLESLDSMKPRFTEWIGLARKELVIADNLAHLIKTLTFSSNRECPPGMY